jgi:uncharacterized membrane protein
VPWSAAPVPLPLAADARITNDFARQVERLMQPGTSALFILDDVGVMEVLLQRIQGLGGTVLKTNVDLERARLIQSTLAQPQKQPSPVQRP